MKNALNNQVGMLGDMFLWLVANLKQGVIYFIKQALPPNISAGSVGVGWNENKFRRIVSFKYKWRFYLPSGWSLVKEAYGIGVLQEFENSMI